MSGVGSPGSVAARLSRSKHPHWAFRPLIGDLQMTQAASAVRKDVPVIVFGRDHSGKAHASWFGPEDAELAGKAAKKMGLTLCSPKMNSAHWLTSCPRAAFLPAVAPSFPSSKKHCSTSLKAS